ncbi:MAG: cyclic pyranopterin monophosphate synthase MoaC [Cytophagales bacterium]|nr:MAG: cyclic pyranopterin monophosphate synthase MoaC [Cytophagales bacterium]TAF62378.1 MAG: cyclic pyranopterin monophosphate synthase MoaC [Cytophagales bacterium]
MTDFSHLDDKHQPRMVDINHKPATLRFAHARARVWLGEELIDKISQRELHTAKGAVFQTAIIAGTMAAKRTHELIPFCHQLLLEDCQITIEAASQGEIHIHTKVKLKANTGAEMEAMTAASVAALTVYDMCKSANKGIAIKEIVLLEKSGGKSHYIRIEGQ